MNGYLGNPTATAGTFEDGWLKTGKYLNYGLRSVLPNKSVLAYFLRVLFEPIMI